VHNKRTHLFYEYLGVSAHLNCVYMNNKLVKMRIINWGRRSVWL